MSQTEFHTGKLKEVDMNGLSLEDYCKTKCNEAGITEIDSYPATWVEQFRDEFWYGNEEKYFIHGEKVYEVIEHEELDCENYFMKLTKNEDGTISFIGQFYNGGTCLDEMLEEALDEM
jgi:hypothetical protein